MRNLLVCCATLLLFACSTENEVIFAAGDDLHALVLFSNDSQFEMLYNGFDTVKGRYKLGKDTIFLNYSADEFLNHGKDRPVHASSILTSRVVINKKQGRIRSVNGRQFCGDISINKLE